MEQSESLPTHTYSNPFLISSQRVWENEWALDFSACEYPYKYDFTYKDRKRRKARVSACLCMRVHFCMCELTFTSLQPLITDQLIYFSFFYPLSVLLSKTKVTIMGI